jgi:hypothetical protein
MPNHYIGDLLHTIGMSGLSRVRTELMQLAVIAALAPHPVQMHRQLPRHRNDRSFLPASPAALGQLQPPAPQITVDAKWSQDMLRSLHQERPQIRIAFLADVHLRLALPRVPSSWLQPQITAHVPALNPGTHNESHSDPD